jgi:hypothetical protein
MVVCILSAKIVHVENWDEVITFNADWTGYAGALAEKL